MRRRHVAKMRPAQPREASFSGTPHAHRCATCGLRYEDACMNSREDGSCTPCRGGRPRPLWYIGRDPAACCGERSRLAAREDINTYRLAGAAQWWICQACKRTHPYNPKENRDE